MRILVVGAGATGGYFGGRLHQAGRDVTFLVRPARARELQQNGLVIRSPQGDATVRDVKLVQADAPGKDYDLVILGCKAYQLDDAIASFAPAVGPNTLVLPLLNGMRHLDVLGARFGAQRVLGGLCLIAATLDGRHEIVHLNEAHALSFGALEASQTARVVRIAEALGGAGFHSGAADNIRQRMWEKWVFLATLASATCLCRAALGDILAAPDGRRLVESLLNECRAVAQHNGFPMGPAFEARSGETLFDAGSIMTASMMRDIENHSPIEADHVIGDLIARGGAQQTAGGPLSLLRVAYTHLKAYEARRAREA